MAFSDFKLPADALRRFSILTRTTNLFQNVGEIPLPEYILQALRVAGAFQKMGSSEMFLREFYIAPILGYLVSERPRLNLFSDEYAISLEDGLSGTPDYLIAWKREPDAVNDPEQRPLLSVAEAKRADFAEGWAQCIAQMTAAQRLNADPETPVWGVVTTGKHWEFAYLYKNELVWHERSIDLDPLEHLIAALSHVLDQCEINGAALEAK